MGVKNRSPWGRRTWYAAASAAVSCGVIGWLLTVVSPGAIARAVRDASVPGLLAYAAASLLSTAFRNERYLVLMRGSGSAPPIGRGDMFLVTLVRNLFSDLLPARIGSTVYIVLLRARFGCPVGVGTSVWAVAFVLDMVVMVPLMAVGIWAVGGSRLGIPPAVLVPIAAGFFMAVAALLWALPGLMRGAGRIARGCFPIRGRRDAVADALARTAAAMEEIRHGGVFWRALGLSLAVRILKYGCISFLVYAVLNPIDPAVHTLRAIGFWPVLVGASLAELSASTPLSGIGGFGAYEGVWAGAFRLLGYPRDLALLSGISAHLITQLFAWSLGAAALLLLVAPVRRRAPAAPRAAEGKRVEG